jgi:endonuclease/exonuclease/phosphatase family metal-dependent hydrolase
MKTLCLTLGFLAIYLGIAQGQNCSNPLQVATYNTLQIAFAPYKNRRLDGAIDYFQKHELDLSVLCLQELWDVDQRNEVINDLKSRYPYSYAANPIATNCAGGCSSAELKSIRDCIDENDCSLLSSNLDECANSYCRAQLQSVGAACVTCLQSGESVLDIFRNLDNCLSNDAIPANQTCFAYEGQNDNLILSTIPFEATDTLYFSESPITVSAALYARLSTSIGTTHVFCTHLLPADLPLFTFEQAINTNQTNELLNWVNTKVTNTSEPILLLGDFNHGPNEWPENSDALINQGYISAYIQAGNTNCTYCGSNPLAQGSDDLIIDHIYLRNAYQVSTERFATYDDYNLESIDIPFIDFDRIPISDHYGVRASVCNGPTPSGAVLASNVRVTDTDYIPGRENSGVIVGFSLLLIFVLL